MAGYTPLFSTLTEGTLYGKWPHTGIWACLLSMVDQHGLINRNPLMIATAVGVPIEQLLACIKDFMSPDPESQSQENEGRRLELIDPARQWGWRVINIGKYREKARLMGKAKREVEDGSNASRLSDRRGPPKTADKRPSDSYSDIDIREDAKHPVPGLDFDAWTRWVAYRRDIHKPIKRASSHAAQIKLSKLGNAQSASIDESIANGYQGFFQPKHSGKAGKVSEWE